MAEKVKGNKITLTEKQINELKTAFETGNFAHLANRLQEAFSSLENINLNVAVIGESGVDRATFINTFRDLYEDDEGAAPTGKVDASKTPVAYPHPKYPNVILWDLLNLGNPDFHAKNYTEWLNVAYYDFFLIIASQHFSSFHAKLAHYIKNAGKDYYFVRTKVDADLESARQSNPSSFDEIVTLQKIREDCMQDLQAEKVKSPEIFLISNILLSKYDFYLLGETLGKNLDLQKSHSFLLATPNISHRILEKKKNVMIEHLWLVAVVACGIQTEAIPNISVVCDVDLLVRTMQGYCISFGLEEDSLRRTAEHVEQPFEQLKALIRSPLAPAITKAQVVELLIQAASKAPKLPKQLVPMATVGLSFAVVYSMLKTFVEDVAADAHRVLVKVFMSHKGTSESEATISKALENQGLS
ncbi:interferon-inducible GTPase 5-like [Python bivittatus]|uniref:Interferon-inducible GTPase 5-like n=1 Tax=Python bivittatus TaxID=176946 RepID=A0A9F2WHK3_PYTBI|nr:interferon-inducible GTPase 5-like [Python bivittatus]